MSAPSPEQLAVLVDRAARRLGADEGELLRAGFAALVAARRSAGGLQAANQRLRAELAAALALLAPDAPSRGPVRPVGASDALGGPAVVGTRVRPAESRTALPGSDEPDVAVPEQLAIDYIPAA